MRPRTSGTDRQRLSYRIETGTAPQIDESAPVSAFGRLRDKIPAPMKKSP